MEKDYYERKYERKRFWDFDEPMTDEEFEEELKIFDEMMEEYSKMQKEREEQNNELQ